MSSYLVPYCERIVSGVEPFNTVSNAAFLLAGIYGFALLRPKSPQLLTVTLLPFCIGIGSGLFHHNPGPLTHALDLIPIVGFAILLSWMVMRLAGWSPIVAVVVLIVWALASYFGALWPDVLAQSLFYVPTVILLFGLSLCIKNQGLKLWLLLLIFSVALTARAADLLVCGLVPIGTHSLWHLFAACGCAVGLKMVKDAA